MHKISITKILIAISFITTVLSYFMDSIMLFWMNNSFLLAWNYLAYFVQMILYSFIHWWIMHLLMNMLFLYYFWWILELLIWRKKYLIFFIFITVFNWILLTFFQWNYNTIWISGFCMAILSYYILELKSRNNPEYKWWITAIVLNIVVWFLPWISLFWHLFWAIWGFIFYFLNKDFLKPKLVGKIKEESLEY